MDCWSPADAMKAYMHTLQLCKNYNNDEKLIEPECMEYISALAAGNRARLMVDAELGGVSPCTVALAVAAKHTGGRLICVRHERAELEETRRQLQSFDLGDVDAEFKLGKPLEVIRELKSISFAVIDGKLEGFAEILEGMDMNPNGSVVVVRNLFHGGIRRTAGEACGRVVAKGRRGAKSVILPFGEGIEVTRIGKSCSGNRVCKRSRRTFFVYEQ